MSLINDPVPGGSTNYGKILPLQTHYSANQPYWLRAGVPITTPVVFADGITVSGGIGVPTGDVAIVEGSLTVVAGGIGVQGEIISHGGMTNDGAPITSVGQDIIATEGGQVTAFDGVNCRVKMATENQALAYVEMTGNTDDGPAIRLAVGGGSAVAPYETYKFGIYANQGGVSPYVEALTVDVDAVVKIAGAPVARPSLVPFVGVSGLSITVPTGAPTVISDEFSVIENHSYRITLQSEIISGDTNAGSYVELDAYVPTNYISLGRQIGGPNNSNGAMAYSAVFKATANASNCVVKALNATIASATLVLNPSDASFNPGILVEDLGIM